MSGMSRRLRGVIGTALTWAGGWSIIGAALGASDAIALGLLPELGPGVALRAVLEGALACGVAGALAGGAFASVLTLAEGRRRLEELRLGRVVLWGVLGTMLLPLGLALVLPAAKLLALSGVLGVLGGGSAAGTLILARTAAPAPVPRRLSTPTP